MKVDIEILGHIFSILQAVITRLKRAKGGDKIWWVRTGAPIARDPYRWMHDGKASCWPAGLKELFFVFPAPHSYWYWLCFPCLLCHILYSEIGSWSYLISIVSFIDCGLRFYAFKKVRFWGCSCPSLAPWQQIHLHKRILCGPTKR